jgi:hypothetical protein
LPASPANQALPIRLPYSIITVPSPGWMALSVSTLNGVGVGPAAAATGDAAGEPAGEAAGLTAGEAAAAGDAATAGDGAATGDTAALGAAAAVVGALVGLAAGGAVVGAAGAVVGVAGACAQPATATAPTTTTRFLKRLRECAKSFASLVGVHLVEDACRITPLNDGLDRSSSRPYSAGNARQIGPGIFGQRQILVRRL